MSALKEQLRFKRRLLSKIMMRAAASGSAIGAPLLERERCRFLLSHQVQSVTRYELWREAEGESEAMARWRSAQTLPIVPMDYRRYRSGQIEWHNQPRRTSGCRKICRLPDIEKMWHVLARDLVTAQHHPRGHIGDWRGRGREHQMDQLLAAIRSEWQAVVITDIRRAFSSVNVNAIYDLPYLPEQLVHRVIDYRTHRFVRRDRSDDASQSDMVLFDDLEVAPTGLMEGSPASNAIFSVLLDDLPDHLGEEIQTFVYCDNIILLAPNMLRAQRAQSALVRYLTGHRAGPFEVRLEVRPITIPFEHLGYSICLDAGAVRVGLSSTNWLRFGHKLEDATLRPEEAIEWMMRSFPHLTEPDLGTLLQVATDEAAYRGFRSNQNAAAMIGG